MSYNDKLETIDSTITVSGKEIRRNVHKRFESMVLKTNHFTELFGSDMNCYLSSYLYESTLTVPHVYYIHITISKV